MRVKLSRICLLAVLLAAGFALFEVGLRIEGGSEAGVGFRNLFMADARIGGVRLRPGARTRFRTAEFETDIAINRQGVRDDEIPPKAPDERRIVVLGDSMVMAVQVAAEQTFCRQMQDRLNAQRTTAQRYRVINAGVQGYGPVEEALFYQYVVQDLQPDIVVVVLYVANDAVEAAASAPRLHGGASPAPAQAIDAAGLRVRLRRLVRRSMVLQIVRQRVLDVTGRFQNNQTLELPPELTMFLPQQPPARIREGLDVTRESVEQIARLAADRAAKTAVVLLPVRFQVSDESWDGMRSMWEQAGISLVRDAASERFREALSPLTLPVFDALPALRAWPRHEEVYFRGAGHLTPLGHRLLADALARFLMASGLLDERRQPALAATAGR